MSTDDGTKEEQLYGPDYWHDAYYNALGDWMVKHTFKRGVELGFAWAISARAYLATQESNLISIDLNDNMNKGDALRQDYPGRWELVQGDSTEQLLALDGKFDYIYVDADHTYEKVVKDLEAAHKKLDKGGVIVCDDYGNPCGVKQAVDEFVKKYKYKLEIMENNPNGGCILSKR